MCLVSSFYFASTSNMCEYAVPFSEIGDSLSHSGLCRQLHLIMLLGGSWAHSLLAMCLSV